MSLLVALVFQAASSQSGVIPLIMSAQGYQECGIPDEATKTCFSLASYRRAADGSILAAGKAVLNASPPVILTVQTKIRVRGQELCGTTDDRDLKASAITIDGMPASEDDARAWRQYYKERTGIAHGREICVTYAPGIKSSMRIVSVGELPAIAPPLPIRWVKPGDGYALVRNQAAGLVEGTAQGALMEDPAGP